MNYPIVGGPLDEGSIVLNDDILEGTVIGLPDAREILGRLRSVDHQYRVTYALPEDPGSAHLQYVMSTYQEGN